MAKPRYLYGTRVRDKQTGYWMDGKPSLLGADNLQQCITHMAQIHEDFALDTPAGRRHWYRVIRCPRTGNIEEIQRQRITEAT